MKRSFFLTLLFLFSMFNLFGQAKNNTNKIQFKFKEPENTACFMCDHAFNHESPILFVSHDNEGDWQFLCGHEDHTEANIKIISLKQATERDSTLNDLYEMPLGVGAERRTINDKWIPFRL